MNTKKKFPQDASREDLNDVEIFKSKEDGQFYYLDRSRKPIKLIPETNIVTDGVTITGSGTDADPLVASGGSSAGYEFTLNHVLGASELTSLVLSPFEIIPQPFISAIFDFKLTFRFVAGTGAYLGSGQDLVIKNSNPYATIPTPNVISINSAMIEELKNGGMVIYGNHSADVGGFEQITPQPTENRFLLTTNGGEFLAPSLPAVGGTLYIDAEFNIIPIS